MDQPILSNDEDAIELLEEKITKLEEEHKQKLFIDNSFDFCFSCFGYL